MVGWIKDCGFAGLIRNQGLKKVQCNGEMLK